MNIRLIGSGKTIAEEKGRAIGAYYRGYRRVTGGETAYHLAVFSVYLKQPAFEFPAKGKESALVRREHKLSNTFNLKMRRDLFLLNIEDLYAISGCASKI